MNPHDLFSKHSHSINQGIARHLGLDCAAVLSHIIYWLQINASKKDAEMIEGKYWMYETQKQIADFLGYLSEDTVQKALKKLVELGILIKGNFNKNAFDRTTWYTVFDQEIIKPFNGIKKMSRIPQNDGMESAVQRNGLRQMAESNTSNGGISNTIEDQGNTQYNNNSATPAPAVVAAVAEDASLKVELLKSYDLSPQLLDEVLKYSLPHLKDAILAFEKYRAHQAQKGTPLSNPIGALRNAIVGGWKREEMPSSKSKPNEEAKEAIVERIQEHKAEAERLHAQEHKNFVRPNKSDPSHDNLIPYCFEVYSDRIWLIKKNGGQPLALGDIDCINRLRLYIDKRGI
jgi:DNA-binding Lrp family transcriptional regulator